MRRIASSLTCMLCIAPRRHTSARAGDYVDTRLNFTLTDENLLVKPGETDPSVPGVRIGQPNSLGILFFDNYDTRYTGYENLTHLVIYKKMGNGALHGRGGLRPAPPAVHRRQPVVDRRRQLHPPHLLVRSRTTRRAAQDQHRADRLPAQRRPHAPRLQLPHLVGRLADLLQVQPRPSRRRRAVRHQHQPGAGRQAAALRRALVRLRRLQDLACCSTATRRSTSRSRSTALLAGAGVDVIKNHLRIEANGGYFDRGTNPLFFGTTVGPMGQTFTDYPVADLRRHAADLGVQRASRRRSRPTSRSIATIRW